MFFLSLTRHPNQMHHYVSAVAVVSTLLAAIGACCTSTFVHSNGGGQCSENFNSSDAAAESCSPCLETFVSKSYFTKYDHLADSTFQEFIAHKLQWASQEDASPRVSDLQRHLISEGSHRSLCSSITLNFPWGFASNKRQCQLIVVERLPDGVFADPFELEHLVQQGVLKDAAVFGDTNLELPSFLSNRSLVEVHIPVPLQISSGKEGAVQFEIEIPLHARYQPLKESGYSKVRFAAPDLFMRCNERGGQRCLLTALNYSVNLRTDITVWNIPTGVQAHAGIVSVVTFAAALLSTTVIVVTSLRHSSEHSKILKQS